MSIWVMLVVGWVFMVVVMSLMWLIQKRSGDSGIVDVAWGLGVAVLAVFFCYQIEQGLVSRRVLIAVLALGWAFRLSGYVLIRVLNMPEDGRYLSLKKDWGENSQKNMFRFYQFQAFGSVLFAVPMLVAAWNPAEIGIWDIAAMIVWIVAIGGESLADFHLHRFRTNPANKGKVCKTGLWSWSRHPNYFFEWLHWWTYVLLAVAAPFGWINILFPMAMLYFILFKTGIPPTERQAVQSRGQAYLDYQKTTNAFFPWPPSN